MANLQGSHMVCDKAQGVSKMDLNKSICFFVLATCVVAAAAPAGACLSEHKPLWNQYWFKNLSPGAENFAWVHSVF